MIPGMPRHSSGRREIYPAAAHLATPTMLGGDLLMRVLNNGEQVVIFCDNIDHLSFAEPRGAGDFAGRA